MNIKTDVPSAVKMISQAERKFLHMSENGLLFRMIRGIIEKSNYKSSDLYVFFL